MKILCLFAGQGYQQKNLFEAAKNTPKALELIQAFSKVASIDLLSTELPITNPKFSQLIIGAYQFTLFQLLKPLLNHHSIDCAGYSLGGVSSFLASTDAPITVAYKILSYRTQLMTSLLTKEPLTAYDLLFIAGAFELEAIKALCHKHECFIAIINLQHHLVIGGTLPNLKKLQLKLSQYKITQSTFLNINLPSHTPFYKDKMGEFQHFLASNHLNTLHYPLFSPITLTKIYDCTEAQILLDQELYTCLQWDKLCNLICEYQYDVIIDLGPGQSMTSFLNLTRNDLKIITTAHYKSFEKIVSSIDKQINV